VGKPKSTKKSREPVRQAQNRQKVKSRVKSDKSLFHVPYSYVIKILPKQRWLRYTVLILISIVTLWVGTMYLVARWYIATNAQKPLTLGASFMPDYAKNFGLDPQQTLDAIINDLGVKHIRLVSYWDEIEKQPGVYDFSELDWEFAMAEAGGAKISLAVGLRQPRWPECHAPNWAQVRSDNMNEWYPKLEKFMTQVVNRYKNNSALENYQLENEFFLTAFGICPDFSRSRLISEYNLVKRLDPNHTLIVSRSNNALGLPVGQPTPDQFGVSVYKRVWDKTITHRYYEYPFPAWFYGFLAGAGKILTGKDMIIHELQAEPWPPSGEIKDNSTEELKKSLDAKRLKDRFNYGQATGIRDIYLWGAEEWYYMKVKRGDSSLWDAAKQEFGKAQIESSKINN